MTGLVHDQGLLLERDREAEAIEDRIARAGEARGSVLLLHGPAGIGKTRLLELACARARAHGMQVLAARGSELEIDFPYGVVRQLFELELASLRPETRQVVLSGAAAPAAAVLNAAEPDAGAPSKELISTLHGLYWACGNLAAEGPIALTIDDAHWADVSSLRWLEFLVHRLEGLPVLVVLAARPDEPGSESPVLTGLRDQPGVLCLEPQPLGLAGVTEIVRSKLALDADDELCAACHESSGGNPFLLSELVATLAADDLPGAQPSPEQVLALGSASVSRSVLARLERLPAEAAAITRALAVLGGQAELPLVAELAGVDDHAATAAAESLARAHVVTRDGGLSFVHPLVCTSVRESLSRAERAPMHAQAARLLARQGARTETVGLHLLAAEPAGDPWVAGWLRRAAARASAGGAAEEAVRYLLRALSEPPPDSELPAVLHELGLAEAACSAPGAEQHMNAAFDVATSPLERAVVALDLARMLELQGRSGAAIEACDRGIAAALAGGSRELALRLEAEAITAATESFDRGHLATPRADRLIDEVSAGATPGERLVLAGIAGERAASASVTHDVTAALAERALAEGDLLSVESAQTPTFYLAVAALALSDRHAAAAAHLGDALVEARRLRAVRAFSWASCWRSWVAYRQGALAQAEDDARTALNLADEHGRLGATALSLAMLLECLMSRGAIDEAQAALARWHDDSAPPSSSMIGPLLVVRGRLRALSGALPEALQDFRTCGRMYGAAGIRNPGFGAWRSGAARILAATGDVSEAVRLADEELALARAYGGSRNLGVALRAAGLVATDLGCAVGLMEEAVSVLEGSEARLEHARALASLGELLARQGMNRDAREPLRQALDLAHDCRATALADTAHAALLGAGGRPRRPRLTGTASLTPSELRVARLAAAGLANREIAERQFVTLRMVEMHLTRAYRKLGISSRAELPPELADHEGE